MTSRSPSSRSPRSRKAPSKSPGAAPTPPAIAPGNAYCHPAPPLALAAVILVLLVTTYALAALTAASSYRRHLAAGNFDFSGHIKFSGQDFLSPSTATWPLAAVMPAIIPSRPARTSLATGATISTPAPAHSPPGRLYFNLNGPVMPVIRYRQGTFLLPLAAGHGTPPRPTSRSTTTFASTTNLPPSRANSSFIAYSKTSNCRPHLGSNFRPLSNGSPATHLTATLSGAQLADIWTAYGKAAPPGCADPNTIGFTGDDLKHVTTHVDLYAGRVQDEVVITLSDKTLGAKATSRSPPPITAMPNRQQPLKRHRPKCPLRQFWPPLSLHYSYARHWKTHQAIVKKTNIQEG